MTEAILFGIYNPAHSRTADLMDTITGLRESYRREWLEQYSDYRLYSALGRWDAEYEYLASTASALSKLCGEFQYRQ